MMLKLFKDCYIGLVHIIYGNFERLQNIEKDG